ncbi:hypothetical protein [uncultured Roseobacter sp.]|uniref:hypothetical protein n=1 Tax=uncultured Roseobacter sp. TaxID=114847 RepID=UPI002630EAAA|nr:hypothetical protein [uncultured Roseobacter sp.]
MKKKQINQIEYITVTADEKQAIFERLLRRNHIRAEVSLPSLDIPKLYRQQLERLMDQKYRERLKPYLEAACEQFPGTPGIPGRMKLHRDAMAHARQALLEAEGHCNPDPEPTTLQKVTTLYTSSKLPPV